MLSRDVANTKILQYLALHRSQKGMQSYPVEVKALGCCLKRLLL